MTVRGIPVTDRASRSRTGHRRPATVIPAKAGIPGAESGGEPLPVCPAHPLDSGFRRNDGAGRVGPSSLPCSPSPQPLSVRGEDALSPTVSTKPREHEDFTRPSRSSGLDLRTKLHWIPVGATGRSPPPLPQSTPLPLAPREGAPPTVPSDPLSLREKVPLPPSHPTPSPSCEKVPLPPSHPTPSPPARRCPSYRPIRPPLPLGEGWGEGRMSAR